MTFFLQNCSFKIDDTSITGVKELSQLEYNASIKSLLLHYQSIYFDEQIRSDKNPSILFNFVISDLLLQNKREKIVELRKFNIDAKVNFQIKNALFIIVMLFFS